MTLRARRLWIIWIAVVVLVTLVGGLAAEAVGTRGGDAALLLFVLTAVPLLTCELSAGGCELTLDHEGFERSALPWRSPVRVAWRDVERFAPYQIDIEGVSTSGVVYFLRSECRPKGSRRVWHWAVVHRADGGLYRRYGGMGPVALAKYLEEWRTHV